MIRRCSVCRPMGLVYVLTLIIEGHGSGLQQDFEPYTDIARKIQIA